MKKYMYSIVIFCLLIFMFVKPTEAVMASKTGVLLWSETIIPTLLPFLILSGLIIQLDIVPIFTYFFAPILSKILGLTRNGAYVFVIGFLCGYPMGAKIASDMVTKKLITLNEGQYLLGFCNNVSPVFVITYIIFTNLQRQDLLFQTVLIIYSAPLIFALLSQFSYRKNITNEHFQPKKEVSQIQINFELVDTCIMNAFKSITILGGYIVLFALITEIIYCLPIPNIFIKNILAGIAELTYGIQTIAKSNIPFHFKYLLIIGITTFGGLSSLAQTKSMIKQSKLSLLPYIKAKIIITGISILLALFLI
jgi:Uncharacterized protein conserved in bacteria